MRSFFGAFFSIPFSIICALLAMITRLVSPTKVPTQVMQYWARTLIAVYGVTLKVVGEEHLKPEKPAIYMANHASMVDIPILIAALKVDLRFIFKKELLYIPFVGQAMYLMGMVPIDRAHGPKAQESLHKAGDQIRDGKHILIFPEGTRTHNPHQLLPFKKGGFYLSMVEKIDIIPVTVINTQLICGRNSMLAKKGVVEVMIHPRIELNEYEGDRKSLIREVKAQIETAL